MITAFEAHGWTRAGLALIGFALTTGVICGVPVVAGQRPGVNLVDMSLEELLTIEVVSASKKSQLITETSAAIYVITADDIRRQNASTLTDLLRQVPGVLVARESTGEWSISIRGFNDKHANKLLVLMDGRTLYSPLYAEVEWDIQDAMLEDIDRIEVIRGSGAAIWGANAVNGVINIIMKPAAETLGGHVALGVGTLEKGLVAARYGGSIGDTAHYRVFSKYFDRASLEDAAGTTPWGGWTNFRQGGRVDWSPSTSDTITFTGEWSRGNLRGPDNEIVSFTPPFESPVEEHDKTSAGFLLTRWTRKRPAGSQFDLQFFYDRIHQSDALGHDKDESIGTTDVEFSHHLSAFGRHDLVWGVGFRQVRDRILPAFDSSFTPVLFSARTYNGFAQDEIALRRDTIRLTVGAKVERNAFSGTEFQPTVRLLLAPAKRHSAWGAVSRAVRVPSRSERHQDQLESIDEDENGDVEYERLVASPLFKPERVTSYETGYRFVPTTRLSLDVASFYNVYDDLPTIEAQESFFTAAPIAGVMTPLLRANRARGRVAGAEVTAFWTVSDMLQLSGNYTRLFMRLHADPESNDEDAEAFQDKNAKNLFYVRAYTDLPHRVDLTMEMRYVGAIPGEGVAGYAEANIHLARTLRQGLRLSLTGDNLFHARHAEWNFGDSMMPSRAIRASLNWAF
jgi:iron complex outermembrane receptor protein